MTGRKKMKEEKRLLVENESLEPYLQGTKKGFMCHKAYGVQPLTFF